VPARLGGLSGRELGGGATLALYGRVRKGGRARGRSFSGASIGVPAGQRSVGEPGLGAPAFLRCEGGFRLRGTPGFCRGRGTLLRLAAFEGAWSILCVPARLGRHRVACSAATRRFPWRRSLPIVRAFAAAIARCSASRLATAASTSAASARRRSSAARVAAASAAARSLACTAASLSARACASAAARARASDATRPRAASLAAASA
jgi:hypothetical protein